MGATADFTANSFGSSVRSSKKWFDFTRL